MDIYTHIHVYIFYIPYPSSGRVLTSMNRSERLMLFCDESMCFSLFKLNQSRCCLFFNLFKLLEVKASAANDLKEAEQASFSNLKIGDSKEASMHSKQQNKIKSDLGLRTRDTKDAHSILFNATQSIFSQA